MEELTNSKKDPVIDPEAEISEFLCFAKAGIGYAFWMRIRYKKPNGIWIKSDKGESVGVGQTGKFDISSKIEDLPDGSLVQLDIDVRAGSDDVYAEQCFVYKKSSDVAAKYIASGTTFNAAVSLDELVSKE